MGNFRDNMREKSQGIFAKAINGLGVVGGIAVTVFTAPLAFAATQPFLVRFGDQHYGDVFGEPFSWLIGALMALGIYFITRMGLASTLAIAGIYLASRLII